MNLFTYGTLMAADLMTTVCGAVYAAQPATLHGYCRRAVRGERYPAIAPMHTEVVAGIVYFDLSTASLARLDGFEGTLYKRVSVVAIGLDGQSITADSYVIKPAAQHCLSAENWSFDEFMAQHKLAFEGEYLGYSQFSDLSAVKAMPVHAVSQRPRWR
jgi:gamma-glutamylcyclotransferase (GGCT)/AIG2-like uncharacterized protein YtfP